MVNHGRTLLLNVSGVQSPSKDYVGEQYVPVDFVARAIPSSLNSCRRILFGDNPDRAMMNWRLQELLTCIHACGFAEYLTALDSRITYWPFNTTMLLQLIRGPVAGQTSGASQMLTFVNDASRVSLSDRIYSTWRLHVVDATTVTLESTADNGTAMLETLAYSSSNGLSTVVPLIGSKLGVRFNSVTDTRWNLSLLLQPRRSLVTVLEDLEIGLSDDIKTALFPDNCPEPYATFSNLWNSHEQLPYRMAGLTLALIYRLNGG